jgi:hypothetical protein
MQLTESSPERAESAPPDAPNAPSGRDANGRFLPGHTVGEPTRFSPGNPGHTRHGLDAATVPAAYAEMAAALLAQSVTDDGGASEIPARRLSQHEYRALVHRRIWQLSDALDARGLFDKRGKLRERWLQRLETLITIATRIDGTLGLERRQKQLPDLAVTLSQGGR